MNGTMSGYSTQEVADLVGVSYRQVDYWVRQGVLTPLEDAHGSGTHRRWSDDDLVELRLVASLRRLGLTLSRIDTTLRLVRLYAGAGALVLAVDRVEAVRDQDIAEAVRSLGGVATVVVPMRAAA
jgi:DNA-binding transcriptional MerR regulator